MKSPTLPGRLSLPFRPPRRSMGSRGWFLILVVATLCAFTVAAVPAQAGLPPGIRASLVADSTELTVGDLVTLSLIVAHPEDSTVVIPRLEREWGPFEVQAQTSVQTVSLVGGIRTVAKQFRVTLFAPGAYETPSLPVSVRGSDGTVGLISPDPIWLTVNSVLLSPDDELRDLRPPADLSTPYWERPIVLALIIIVALGLPGGTILLLYHRSRRAGEQEAELADPRTPWEVAIQELDRIASLDLPREGDMKGHYTLVAALLRRYLGATYLQDSCGPGADDMSTEEITAGIRQCTLDSNEVRVVVEVLQEADLVKFANLEPVVDRAQEVESLVREFVERTAPALAEAASAGHPVAQGATP